MDSLLPHTTPKLSPSPSLSHGKETAPCNRAGKPVLQTSLAPTHRPWGWTCNGVFIPLEVRPEMPISYR
jgi:hypothetical protein